MAASSHQIIDFKNLVDQFSNSEMVIDVADITFDKKLGEGTSGVTFLGELRGEKVAIKTYSEAMLMYDTKSVRNEMEILSKVRHKNVVQLRGIVLREDFPSANLVTQFSERGELGNALYSSRLLPRSGDPLRFKIAIGIAEGLQYLHSRNIIHRDIKPTNILLSNDLEPILNDFGFSRFLDRDATDNMTGETGSYRYMAPEVACHSKYSEKADLYSFSILCNEIFTGEKPFEYQAAICVVLDVVRKNLRPPQEKIRNERLKTIIANCWDQNPVNRPSWDVVISELKLAEHEMNKKGDRSISSLFRRKVDLGG